MPEATGDVSHSAVLLLDYTTANKLLVKGMCQCVDGFVGCVSGQNGYVQTVLPVYVWLFRFCDETRKNFEATLDWLQEHACSRTYGLGEEGDRLGGGG